MKRCLLFNNKRLQLSSSIVRFKSYHIKNVNYYSTSSTNNKTFSLKTPIGIVAGILTGYLLSSYFSNNDSLFLSSSNLKKSTTPLELTPKFKYAQGESLKQGFQALEALVGQGSFTRTPAELDYHSDSYFNVHKAEPGQKPKLILYPNSTEQVSEIMKICTQFKLPIVPFSGGTSLEGQYILTRPGVVLDLSRLNKIVKFNKEDLDITVQAGLGWQDLDEFLKPEHLIFGPDPGPGAQIGGMVGTSCSGTQAFRYGTMKENVLNLTVVLADGTILKTKQRSKKSAAGYNLTGLFIGSEGTLGIVTEATLKLCPRPNLESVIIVNFETILQATKTVETLLKKGTVLEAVELLDSHMVDCVNELGQTQRKYIPKPTLLFKVGAQNQTMLNENIKVVKQASKDNKSINFEFAKSEEEKFELWQARKLALFSTIDYGKSRLGQDAKVWITDVAVPILKLLQIISDTREEYDKYADPTQPPKYFATCLGHVGDGNFHLVILYKPEVEPLIKKITTDLVNNALKYEGTCTGEHGVGMGKRNFLVKEVGQNSIDLMRHIKVSLDPYGLLNTDKVFKMDINDDGH